MEQVISFPNAADRMAVIKSEHRRLVILRLLEKQPGYRSNERVIADCLHDFALSGAGAEVRACFEFLEQSGLVSNALHEEVLISSLTRAGQEFLDGCTIVEGVYRPRPDHPTSELNATNEIAPTLQYALVDNQRLEAFPGGSGQCPTCGSRMVAKCGPRIMHHWAHAGRRNCDPWWENETPWHRAWKSLFPAECREICHVAPDGEVHRADIKTPTGIVIEVQHSAMSDAERLSREAFYGNLVWIIDGSVFRDNFDIYHLLPDPLSALAQDLVWEKAIRPMKGAARGLFYRLSEALAENPKTTRATMNGGWIHGLHEIEEQVNQAYRGHHQYDWVRPRRTWLDATCPVYIDLGKEFLARLEVYDESGLPCVRLVSKRKFVHDAMVETTAKAIASRFYPLPRPD